MINTKQSLKSNSSPHYLHPTKPFSILNNEKDKEFCKYFILEKLPVKYNVKLKETHRNLELMYFSAFGRNPASDYLNYKRSLPKNSGYKGNIYIMGNIEYSIVNISLCEKGSDKWKDIQDRLQEACMFEISVLKIIPCRSRKKFIKLTREHGNLRVNRDWFKIDGELETLIYNNSKNNYEQQRNIIENKL